MGERRNYRSEIKAAADAGDVMGLLMLATELAARAEHADERRERDSQRKRRVRGNPRTSADSVGQTVPSGTPPEVSPYKPLPNPPESESERIARSTVEQAMGEEFADVERFVGTRGPAQRGEWWKSFASGLTSGWDRLDVAGACRDAMASSRPVEGLHAMRAFVSKHRQQRVESSRPPPGVGGGQSPRSHTGGVAARTYANALKALEDV